MPLSVSVALCTYNGAAFVETQVRSILAQQLLPAEVVLADDGSTDDTVALVRSLFAGQSAVLLVELPAGERLGVTRNFERAAEACTADLIALCDQDDVWHPDKLSAAVSSFDHAALDLQNTDARLIDEHGAPLGRTLFESLLVSEADRAQVAAGAAFATYLRRNLVTGATVLFRRSLLQRALPFPPEWVHDEWLAIIAAATGEVELLDAPLIDYRQHSANQIGVAAPTLRRRFGRMLEPRGTRYVDLAVRAGQLVERLEQLDAPAGAIELAREKLRFETVRAGYPRGRLARVRQVLQEYRTGSYGTLSSQRGLDVARDILQPA